MNLESLLNIITVDCKDNQRVFCFSLCVPTFGDMHSDKGVLVRKKDLPVYCKIMELLANGLAH